METKKSQMIRVTKEEGERGIFFSTSLFFLLPLCVCMLPPNKQGRPSLRGRRHPTKSPSHLHTHPARFLSVFGLPRPLHSFLHTPLRIFFFTWSRAHTDTDTDIRGWLSPRLPSHSLHNTHTWLSSVHYTTTGPQPAFLSFFVPGCSYVKWVVDFLCSPRRWSGAFHLPCPPLLLCERARSFHPSGLRLAHTAAGGGGGSPPRSGQPHYYSKQAHGSVFIVSSFLCKRSFP